MKIAWVTLGAALLCGCATTGKWLDGVFSGPRVSYALASPGEGWELHRDKASDVVFRREIQGATFYADSTCEGFSDAPLKVLANHLFFNFDEVEIRQQQIFRLDNRDALERLVRVRLDGAEMGVAVTVMKKNACVFDFVLVAPTGGFEDLLPVYRQTVGSFHVVTDGQR